MSKKREALLHRKVTTLEEALDYIEKLKSRIRKNETTLKKLKSENKTLNKTWDKTENYLDDVTGDKPLGEVIKTVRENGKLKKENGPCPKCGRHTIDKLIFTSFHIVICETCDYRTRVNGITSKTD